MSELMPGMAHARPDTETPVNPYSLLEAVNNSSDTAHRAWLIFLGLMTYLMVAVAGVTNRDLLLETPVSLPILQVSIQLTQFFQFAPVLLMLLHLGVVSQLVLLARKTLEFDHAIRLLESSERRTHPLRLELHNFFFVQAVAGPERSNVMGGFLHAMSWLTLVVLPVVLILYIQVVFLPYHSIAITWSHRIALVIDIAMLVMIGVFLIRAETSFFKALARTTAAHPLSFLVTAAVLGMVALFSFAAATVPGEALDRMSQRLLGVGAEPSPTETGRGQRYLGGFTLPFFGARADGSLFGIFTRNLVVTDTDLVADRDVTPGEPTLKLRGRDLRFARLDRSDLHQADMTGADISNASFVGADLKGVWLQCADLNELLLSDNRKTARCASARGADLSRARLEQAILVGIDLSGAKLEEARLEEAELTFALLVGANFSSAHLEKADLTGGVQAQGANFLIASLQGADLTGAQLQYADFSSAGMQAAGLNYAGLQGAVLRDADLEGATIQQAKLFGADMTGAKLVAADLRYAEVWASSPPAPETMQLADMTNLVLSAPGDTDHEAMRRIVDRISVARTRKLVQEALQPVLDREATERWAASPDHQRWRALADASASAATGPAFAETLTVALGDAMCRPRWSQGSVATGIARRAQASVFRGAMLSLFERLKSSSCPALPGVATKVMRDFTNAVDVARSSN
ncbi:MAG: pentapeptide repeat-containing protein [Hyphomicrobiaceae bacterium]|nr:pentapeptide repeat-containing protein [Hyphomicrobiaceae bacterium]